MSTNSILSSCILLSVFGIVVVESWTTNQPALRPVCSFPSKTRIHAKRQQEEEEERRDKLNSSRFLSTNNNNNNNQDPFRGISNLLDDGNGHIRSDLATSIWNWEHEHRTKDALPKFTYSTRAGLRLVNDIAKELLTSSSNKNANDRTVTTYSDLVQEGLVALMYCMSKYNADVQQDEPFEQYAKRHILASLQKVLAKEFRPIQLPAHVLKLLKSAQRKRQTLQTKMMGREPTMAQVAQELNVSPQQLELYTMLGVSTLSVERTMEIYDPLVENKATFADEHDYQVQFGDVTEEIRQQPEEAQEGEDEMWYHVESVAAPLSEMIVDDDAFDNPDAVLSESMIHDHVQEFLSQTLDAREMHIVKQRFGLESGQVTSLEEIGAKLGISASRVSQIEHEAMTKLRNSYTSADVETYLEEAAAVKKEQQQDESL